MVQEPGQVLYIPQGLPHAIHNLDNNIALTRNQLFSVGHIIITLRACPYMASPVSWVSDTQHYDTWSLELFSSLEIILTEIGH